MKLSKNFQTILFCLFLLGLVSPFRIFAAPYVATIASSNPAVPAANLCPGSTKDSIYSFSISLDNGTGTPNFIGFNFSTNGTYSITDINKFQLWFNISNDLASATQISTNIISNLGVGTHSFTAFSQALVLNSTSFFWITTDVSGVIPATHTLQVSAITTSNITMAAGSKTGTAFAGGIQTIFSVNASITEDDASGTPDDGILCSGGTASLTALPAPPGHTYLWSPGSSTSQVVNNLGTGTYTVTVTNSATGCTSTSSFLIFSGVFSSSVSEDDASGTPDDGILCSGGTASLTASPAPPGHTYLWSPGSSTTQVVNNLGTGTYTVIVTNTANGCTSTSSSLISSGVFSSSITEDDASGTPDDGILCSGGTASLTALPAPPGHTYLWSPGSSTTQVVNNLGTGTYTVTVTNTANGCTGTSSSLISSGVFSSSITESDASGNANDSILCVAGDIASLTAHPGPAGYTYLWSQGSLTNQTINVTAAGFYTVTLTNTATGCTSTSLVEIIDGSISASITEIDSSGNLNDSIICAGDSALLTACCGSSYLWSNGKTTNSIYAIIAGTYTVLVTSNNGCASINIPSIIISGSTLPNTQITSTDTTGLIDNDGIICEGDSVLLTATPSTSVTYLWSTGKTTGSIYVNASGTYTVTATNFNGCSKSKSFPVVVNPLPIPNIIGDSIICHGTNTQLTVVAPNHILNSFQWSTGNTTNPITLTNSPDGTTNYTITVTDDKGCFASVVDSVHVIIIPIVNPVSDITKCAGEIYPSKIFTGTNSENLHYFWNNNNITIGLGSAGIDSIHFFTCDTAQFDQINTAQITVIPKNSYPAGSTIDVCPGDSEIFNIIVNPIPTLTLPTDTIIICSGEQIDTTLVPSFSISNNITVTCSWTPVNVDPDVTIIGNHPGTDFELTDILKNERHDTAFTVTYLVTLTYSNNGTSCSHTDNVIVKVNPAPSTPVVSDFTAVGNIVPGKLCGGSEFMGFNVTNNPGNGVNYAWTTSSIYDSVYNGNSANPFITFNNSGTSPITVIVYVTASNSSEFGNCPNKSASYPITILPGNPVQEQPIVPKEPGHLLVYLDNTANGYRWGFEKKSDRIPHFIPGQVYQAFVPDTNSSFFDQANEKLDTLNYDFWVMAYYIFPPDTCRSKIYYNGPFKIHWREEMEAVPDEITAIITPNPNNGNFDLLISGNIYGNVQIRIVNALGQIAAVNNFEKVAGIQKYALDVSHLSQGLYLLQVQGSGEKENCITKLLIK